MQTWFAEAIREADPADRLLLVRRRRAIERLHELELRDRWGYVLEPLKLAAIAEEVVLNLDHQNLNLRARQSAVLAEAVDRLALAMALGNVPMFCDGYDTEPEDASIETVIRSVIDLKESSS